MTTVEPSSLNREQPLRELNHFPLPFGALWWQDVSFNSVLTWPSIVVYPRLDTFRREHAQATAVDGLLWLDPDAPPLTKRQAVEALTRGEKRCLVMTFSDIYQRGLQDFLASAPDVRVCLYRPTASQWQLFQQVIPERPELRVYSLGGSIEPVSSLSLRQPIPIHTYLTLTQFQKLKRLKHLFQEQEAAWGVVVFPDKSLLQAAQRHRPDAIAFPPYNPDVHVETVLADLSALTQGVVFVAAEYLSDLPWREWRHCSVNLVYWSPPASIAALQQGVLIEATRKTLTVMACKDDFQSIRSRVVHHPKLPESEKRRRLGDLNTLRASLVTPKNCFNVAWGFISSSYSVADSPICGSCDFCRSGKTYSLWMKMLRQMLF